MHDGRHVFCTPRGGEIHLIQVQCGWNKWEWSATRRAWIGDRPREPQWATLREARAAVQREIEWLRSLLAAENAEG